VPYTSNRSKEEFCASVEKAKAHIQAGDIFQVVISQRLTTEYAGDPFDLYRSLRLINPSPYMAYFNFNGWQIIGSSPEVMVKADLADDAVPASRRHRAPHRWYPPPRQNGEDKAYEQDLLQDPKEIAEHVMLVDLGRNDLGRVCTSGSVRVDELMVVERYSHVMHIVSNVVGRPAARQNRLGFAQSLLPRRYRERGPQNSRYADHPRSGTLPSWSLFWRLWLLRL
jgi:anthranilate synthase component 1